MSWDKGRNEIFPLVLKKKKYMAELNKLTVLHWLLPIIFASALGLRRPNEDSVCKTVANCKRHIWINDTKMYMTQTWHDYSVRQTDGPQNHQQNSLSVHTPHPQWDTVTCGWMEMTRFFMQKVLFKISLCHLKLVCFFEDAQINVCTSKDTKTCSYIWLSVISIMYIIQLNHC